MQNCSLTRPRSSAVAGQLSLLQRSVTEASASGRNTTAAVNLSTAAAAQQQNPPQLSTQPEESVAATGPGAGQDQSTTATATATSGEEEPTPTAGNTQEEDEETVVIIVTEDGADLPSYSLTETDQLLDSVYGDHLHQNDGIQLDGGVSSNRF